MRQKYRQRMDLMLLSTTYWTLGAKPHEVDRSFVQQRMGHACEWETSMMLRLAPQLVGDYKAARSRAAGRSLRAGPPRLDHQGPHRAGPHRRSAARHGRERANCSSACSADDVAAFLERVVAWDGKSAVV